MLFSSIYLCYNLAVMARKARKAKETPVHKHYGKCSWYGCLEVAEYPAPRYRASTDDSCREHIYFCIDHVREYNAAWDFFRGMTQKEIEDFQKEAVIGHRPTKKIRNYKQPKIHDSAKAFFDFDFEDLFGIKNEKSKNKTEYSVKISEKDKEALAVLDLKYPVTAKEIKMKYKELVKLYHPDINGNDKKSEEKFKIINQAYNLLKNSSLISGTV